MRGEPRQSGRGGATLGCTHGHSGPPPLAAARFTGHYFRSFPNMGRRALPRLDPTLDVSQHLRALDALPRPFAVAAEFGSSAPLEIEIGCGKGLFLLNASGAIPEHCFLGCEVSGKYARFAAAKLARAGRGNARIVHGDATLLLRECLTDASVVAVHVYFPDPWWKKRHLRRRIMQEAVVRDIERVLQPGGSLHFWTDVEEYFHATIALLQQVTQLQGPYDVSERPAAHELDYRTHFERRMRMHEHPVYRSEFRRV